MADVHPFGVSHKCKKEKLWLTNILSASATKQKRGIVADVHPFLISHKSKKEELWLTYILSASATKAKKRNCG